tara:strand:+ start:940 stop:1371 length:432 start_codon:yes stop_codon:yes gene_type:complete
MSKKINPKYVPKSLTPADRKKQIKSIKEGTDRPKVDSFKSKRSGWAKKFEDKYGYKISETSKIAKSIISKKGIDEILKKGRAAYYNGGSRPNQTSTSWARARLASVLMKGPALKVDKNIVAKYAKDESLKKKALSFIKKKPSN